MHGNCVAAQFKDHEGYVWLLGMESGPAPTLKLVSRRGQAAVVACTNIGDKRWASDPGAGMNFRQTQRQFGAAYQKTSRHGLARSAQRTRRGLSRAFSSLGIKNPFKINVHIGNSPAPG
jgi:hypothetical protein